MPFHFWLWKSSDAGWLNLAFLWPVPAATTTLSSTISSDLTFNKDHYETRYLIRWLHFRYLTNRLIGWLRFVHIKWKIDRILDRYMSNELSDKTERCCCCQNQRRWDPFPFGMRLDTSQTDRQLPTLSFRTHEQFPLYKIIRDMQLRVSQTFKFIVDWEKCGKLILSKGQWLV